MIIKILNKIIKFIKKKIFMMKIRYLITELKKKMSKIKMSDLCVKKIVKNENVRLPICTCPFMGWLYAP